MPKNLKLAGTSKDGDYQFHGEVCKANFLDYYFQMPLDLGDNPYSNTGVLFGKKGES